MSIMSTRLETTGRRITSVDLGLFLIRAILGVVFVFHGGQKLFGLFGGYGLEATAGWMESIGIPFPMLSATLAGATEFFGGLLLISGFATRLVAVPLTFTMLVAAFTHTGFSAQSGGMEYPLTLALVAAGLALTGAGRLGVSLPFARLENAAAPASAVQ